MRNKCYFCNGRRRRGRKRRRTIANLRPARSSSSTRIVGAYLTSSRRPCKSTTGRNTAKSMAINTEKKAMARSTMRRKRRKHLSLPNLRWPYLLSQSM